ncbi:MAG: sulfite exporter TauE/SafE family protein [Armatimonadetes bacterium]|nr:sulfite exporter TauE/SafE family protein [Armatimonadota bacterium]MDE2205030.1 sulfite exporter TauE/SafE family protein [Armatimonadota bacterium]
MTPLDYLLLFAAAFAGGAVNAVAGGGTLLTFPSLLWAGLPARVANAVSTAALWPGQLSSLWGYRKQLRGAGLAVAVMFLPSMIGGAAGALLLIKTSNGAFERIVPWLILLATCLFLAQEPISRAVLRRRATNAADGSEPSDAPRPSVRWLMVAVFQVFVATYGGYFGAGIGIVMLAVLALMGLQNIHQMNGVKAVNALTINAVATCLFISQGLINWRLAAWMAVGSILGGYLGAGLAQRAGQRAVRRTIIVIGLGLAVALFVQSAYNGAHGVDRKQHTSKPSGRG